MTTALVGYTGFVGGTLTRADHFDILINRANLESLRGMSLRRLVCAGLPAVKWIANERPQEDADNVRRLEATLSEIRAETFVLISTIDVYSQTGGVNESFECLTPPAHAYGANRLRFEQFVRRTFPQAHVVRLPALFGPGLRKNILYDLLHRHRLERINLASQFQWYPVIRLADDLRTIEKHDLRLVNLFTEPIMTHTIVRHCFPRVAIIGSSPDPVTCYDLRTHYGALFGGDERYALTSSAILTSITDFVSRERIDV